MKRVRSCLPLDGPLVTVPCSFFPPPLLLDQKVTYHRVTTPYSSARDILSVRLVGWLVGGWLGFKGHQSGDPREPCASPALSGASSPFMFICQYHRLDYITSRGGESKYSVTQGEPAYCCEWA